jgi:hypothetical protein
MTHRLLFDKSVQMKQLDVIEQHGILLFRAGDKGKDCNVHVFRLSELEVDGDSSSSSSAGPGAEAQDDEEEDEDEEQEAGSRRRPTARTRAHAKQRRLERTKGCHLYCLTRPGGSHLRMVS